MSELLVDAGPVIEHVRALHRKGMPVKAISRSAGVQVNKFYLGYTMDDNRVRHEVLRCRAENAQKILAVTFQRDDIGDGFSGVLVQRAREAAGIGVIALSRLTGMDPNTVRRWERGENRPRMRAQVEKVAAAIGVPYDTFFGPVEPLEDAYTEEAETEAGRPVGEDDYIMTGYPCGVCGVEFKSRIRLATHSHDKKGAGV